MAFKIEIDEDECIGCAACITTCDNFEMDEGKNKAKAIESNVKEIGCNQDAADVCPVQCIKIKKV